MGTTRNGRTLFGLCVALVATGACNINRTPQEPSPDEGNGSNLGTSDKPVFGAGKPGLRPDVIITPHAADPAVCGNGQLELGEACDPGLHACCLDDCSGAKPASEVCREADGECDVAEHCDGRTFECPDDGVAGENRECRAAAGACDVAEHCDGESKRCPEDAFEPTTTVCRAAEDLCDAAETCPGDGPTCPDDAVAEAGSVCRAARPYMLCDAVEVCDGESKACPEDRPAPQGTICRFPSETCDRFAACDGESMECPPLVMSVAPAGTTCRPAAGPCDREEVCDGTSTACPADSVQPATFVCRAATEPCDVAERCTGSSIECPVDRFVTAGTQCRAANGVCDVAESCTGTSPSCPPDGFRPSSTVCRAANGVCDVAENCTGSSAACPEDEYAPSGTQCRAANGVCDVPESCTGSSPSCPADGFVSSGTQCRAEAGPCDVAETCTGSSASCPANEFASATTECRPRADICEVGPCCDVAETCTGSSASCPPDAFASPNTVCRPAASGDLCDAPEYCSGQRPECPGDANIPEGGTCSNGLGTCQSDICCPGATELESGTERCSLRTDRMPRNNIVFVTSRDFRGAIGAEGLAAADARCNQRADAANLAGTYHAWLSGGRTGGIFALQRVGSGPYLRVDGASVAANENDLADGQLANPIALTEEGERRPDDTMVWTGTSPGGSTTSAVCGGGTEAVPPWTDVTLAGTVGRAGAVDASWTQAGNQPCEMMAALYCVQDDCPGFAKVNFQSDPNHCGECNRRCATNQVCREGDCVTLTISPIDPGPIVPIGSVTP